MSDIVIAGQDAVEAALGRLENTREIAQKMAIRFAEKAQTRLGNYPGEPHRPVIWASERQRRWYFATRRAAGLPLEYDRIFDPMSEQVGLNWNVEETPGGAVVGNNVPYAAYVQGWQAQSAQHKATGWITEKTVAEQLIETEMPQIAESVLSRVF